MIHPNRNMLLKNKTLYKENIILTWKKIKIWLYEQELKDCIIWKRHDAN